MACMRKFIADFFDYETPVMLRTKAKRVGVIYRAIQTATLSFFILYSIVYLKGYQLMSDSASSVILTRIQAEPTDMFSDLVYNDLFLKNCRLEVESNNPDDTYAYFHGGPDILLPFDFSIMTQVQGVCPEDPLVPKAKCDPKNNTCVANTRLPMGNGRMTGKCIPAIITNDTVCEVTAWCPVISNHTRITDVLLNESDDSGKHKKAENEEEASPESHNAARKSPEADEETSADEPPETHSHHEHPEGFDVILELAEEVNSEYYGPNATASNGNGSFNFKNEFIRMKLWNSIKDVTIVIKNPVAFSAFKETRTNYNTSGIPCWRDTEYEIIPKNCPIFSVEDILKIVADKIDNVSADDLIKTGGVIASEIHWECDFDVADKEKSCNINYDFTRVDQPRSGVGQTTLFLSDHESDDPPTKRTAVQLTSIRFIFNVDVRAGKFNAIELLFKLGAAFGLFSIATLLCEYVFLNTDWLVKRTVVEMKYLEPTDGSPRTKRLVVVQSRDDNQENGEISQ